MSGVWKSFSNSAFCIINIHFDAPNIFCIINPLLHMLDFEVLLTICFGSNFCKAITKNLYQFFALRLFGYILKYRAEPIKFFFRTFAFKIMNCCGNIARKNYSHFFPTFLYTEIIIRIEGYITRKNPSQQFDIHIISSVSLILSFGQHRGTQYPIIHCEHP